MARWRTAPALVLEDVQTGDGRVMAPGSIEWAALPLPLAWLRDGDQHISLTEVGPQIGTIDLIRRDAGGIIYAEGEIDENNPDGAEPVRRMADGSAPLGNRFPVSIDPDNWEVEIILTDVGEAEDVLLVASGSGRLPSNEELRTLVANAMRAAAGDPDPGEGGGDGGEVLFQDSVDEILERYTRLRIRGATLCSVAAFDQAAIELISEPAATASTESGVTPLEAIVLPVPAVAAALPAPNRPPAAWLSMPYPESGDERLVEQVDGSWAVPLTITDDGQVFGHLARRDQGHRGLRPRFVPPPTSSTGYREFHTGYVVTAEGDEVAVGPLVVAADHAPLRMRSGEARDFYANSGLGWADVRASDGEFGPWVCGALRPDVTEEDLRVLRALSLSGDWRDTPGHGLELICALSVNVPGFPIAREALAASAYPEVMASLAAAAVYVEEGEVISLVAAGIVTRCAECAERARERDALSAALSVTDELLATMRDAAATLRTIERRTRPLEPAAAASLIERVRG